MQRRMKAGSPEETAEIGRELAHSLHGGELILLRGSLGAGKTTLARGLAEALGVGRWRGSPTFTLVNEYVGQCRLNHIDLYRLTESEAEDLGFDEYVSSESVTIIEWPERAAEYVLALPAARRILVDMSISGPEERTIEMRDVDGRGLQ